MENVGQIVNTLASNGMTLSGLNGTFTCDSTTNGGTYAGGSITVGGCYPYSNYYWWPTYWPSTVEDRHAKAFRVVKVLMENKTIKLTSIEKFIKLVDEITNIL